MTILERDLICLFQTNTASVGRKKRHARRQEISTPIFSWAAFLVSRIVPFNATYEINVLLSKSVEGDDNMAALAPIRRAAVIGAGQMGLGIASVLSPINLAPETS